MKKRKDGRFRTSYTKDGVTKYFYAATEREAKKEKEEYKREIQKSPQKHEEKISFRDVAEKWLASKESQVKPITLKMYREKVSQLSEVFGQCSIYNLSIEDMQKFIDNKFRDGYSKSYLKKHITVLNQIFSYAILPLKILSANPCSILKVSKFAHESERRSLTEKEIKIVFDTFEDDVKRLNEKGDNSTIPFSLYPIFMIFIGLRRSEQVPLEWKNVDLDNNTVTVSRVINYENNCPVIYNFLKNGSKKRVIPIPSSISGILQTIGSEERRGYIFSQDGKMLKENQLKNLWEDYLERTSLKITQHMLRHTFATLLFKAGVDPKTAQYFMGHKSLETTLRIYTHLEEETREEKAFLLDQYVQKRFNFGLPEEIIR